ncbi:unnamed protein product [Paramecium pentaurelia]|uniref:Uncharacterized protein n=1 Tax=Paramecium pentaurelia TaxID=43138 RepID=A0A8S1WKA1_9CILI|nr:unnamed protein product [Paramecium pentaurelia]
MQQSDLIDFSFSLQYPNEVDIEKPIHFNINSSADISSEEENDLEQKIKQLYSKTKQALQSIDQKEILKKGKNIKNQTNISSYLVCSKSLPYSQLFISNNIFTRNHQIKGFTTISTSQNKQEIERQDNNVKKYNKYQTKQKIQFNSYFSVPNRNICYSYINN